jgi:hypothetical protein
MKTFPFILFCFIIGCSSQNIHLNGGKKIIQIKCTIGDDTLNTFNNTFTRIYFSSEVYTITFHFSIEEQHKNLSYDTSTPIQNIIYRTSGDWGYQFCDILLNEKRKKIVWIDFASYKDSVEYIGLNSVMRIIREIVLNRDEVKKLPMEAWY